MEVLLANPRGFCAGVDRAIEIVNRVIQIFGAPTYVRHEVVHNRYVVESLRAKGAVFVQELDEVPDGGVVIFSAHGVSRAVQAEAARRGLRVFDATCPLVTKVHLEVVRHVRAGRQVVLIGHAGHPEVEGTLGQVGSTDEGMIHLVEDEGDVERLEVECDHPLAYVTQTTLSMDDAKLVIAALRRRYPAIEGPRKDDICYATQNRQDAVKLLASRCEVVLVVGSRNSSNSNRLREVAERMGSRAYLIDNAGQMESGWFQGVTRVGLTAGASAPEILVNQVVERLREAFGAEVRQCDGVEEHVVFPLPKALQG